VANITFIRSCSHVHSTVPVCILLCADKLLGDANRFLQTTHSYRVFLPYVCVFIWTARLLALDNPTFYCINHIHNVCHVDDTTVFILICDP
jgi:hypothetical protein